MCDIVFEKTKGRGGRVNKMSVNAEARTSRWKGSLKKLFWEILQNSQENTCAGKTRP